MSETDDRNAEDNLSIVITPSGTKFYVHDSEVAYFQERVKKYESDNHFTNISDLQDLDKIVIYEMLIWRWSMWLSQKRDYWGEPIDENVWQKAVKEYSAEIRQLKKALGLDKETRDKQRGEGSFQEWLKSAGARAREFGYMRNEQAEKSIELFMELRSLIDLHDNCDADEQREQHVTTEDLIDWLRGVAIPEFQEIDEKFRATSQRYWIEKM